MAKGTWCVLSMNVRFPLGFEMTGRSMMWAWPTPAVIVKSMRTAPNYSIPPSVTRVAPHFRRPPETSAPPVHPRIARAGVTQGSSGYATAAYAASLSAHGTPRELPNAGAWILEREIPGAGARDAMSTYPLLVARDWSKLQDDLADLGTGLVSLVAVTDPLGDYDEDLLHGSFPDRVVPFKEHYVVELERGRGEWVAPHHRRNAERARARVRVAACADPATALDDWVRLYGVLTERHAISGIAAFSRDAFAQQLRTPGIVVLRAEAAGE